MLLFRRKDQRLLGKWRSDRERTLVDWVFASDNGRAGLENSFGRLELEYTPDLVRTSFEGHRTECPYRVLASDAESVAILRDTEGKNEIQHINFDGPDLYWVPVGRNREFFRRAAG